MNGARGGEHDKENGDQVPELAFGQRWEGPKAKRPSIANMGNAADGRRKSSVQFHTAPAEETIRRESQIAVPRLSTVGKLDLNRRMSSPPPPNTYKRGVSFDTFDNKDATDFSLTLQYKHKDYKHSRRSRTFLCGADQNDYSEFALEWLLDELVDDGDEIVCLRAIDRESSGASVDGGKYKDQAMKLLRSVIAKNAQEDKAISLIMELAAGKVEKVIQRMVFESKTILETKMANRSIQIQIYEPAVLIVGTRGRNLAGMQSLLPGSVSKYCLQQSPIPVIVVRSSQKRLRKKRKRQLDPTRSLYSSMIHQAQQAGGTSALDKVHEVVLGTVPEATEKEAAAVLQAIGAPKHPRRYGGRLARVTSISRGDPDSGPESGGEGFLPAGIFRSIVPDRADLVLKTPQMAALAGDVWDDDDADDDQHGGNVTFHDDDAEQTPEQRSAMLGVAKTVDQRRPSVRETNPWLNQILQAPDKGRRLSPGPGYGHGRSLSR